MRMPCTLASLLLLTGASAPPDDLLQAVHAGNATWLLRETGQLSRLDDGAAAPVTVEVPVRAAALCRTNDTLTLVGKGKGGWQILHRRGDGWQASPATPALPGEYHIGTACSTGDVTVLTSERIIDERRGIVPVIGYERSMSIRTVVYREPDALLVGTNAGEWGGKLLRIPLSSGRVAEVPNTGAPIHDIAAAPGKPGCVVLAIGLSHIFPSGKLTELCGTSARRLYARSWEPEGLKMKRAPEPDGKDPYPSVAFYGLVPARDGSLRAIAMDGIYRITASGTVRGPVPLPAFVPHGDLRIARVGPDLDLVLTGVNARVSVGGAMPIAIPR